MTEAGRGTQQAKERDVQKQLDLSKQTWTDSRG